MLDADCRCGSRCHTGHFQDLAAFFGHLGQSKIENLRVLTVGNENVRRLNVAMNDAFGMRGLQGIRNLNR